MAAAETSAARRDTVPRLLAFNAEHHADKPAYREKEFGIWQSWSWAEAASEINKLAAGLLTIGLKPGDHVALLGRNRPYFYWAMIAAQTNGAVPVPVYQDSVADEIAYVLAHCSARYIFAEDQEQVDKILEIQDKLPELKGVIYLDEGGMRKYDRSQLHNYRDVQAAGENASQK
ncbi:MAG: AMP-binding protein [Candidatus Puniceispirillaceae bacterium]